MLQMNYWPSKWALHESVCPCDVHFNDWIAKQKLRDKAIFHFGSGTHHVVGVEQARRKNHVLAITASKEECESYVQLAAESSAVARRYVVYFGDIYLTNPSLLPVFDVVSLFHLCEFARDNTASKAYGGLTDAKLLDLFTDKTREGGHLLLYKGSSGMPQAAPIIARWEKQARVNQVDEFKTLLVYQKR